MSARLGILPERDGRVNIVNSCLQVHYTYAISALNVNPLRGVIVLLALYLQAPADAIAFKLDQGTQTYGQIRVLVNQVSGWCSIYRERFYIKTACDLSLLEFLQCNILILFGIWIFHNIIFGFLCDLAGISKPASEI